jgi:signal transduction histidine kinase
LALTTIVVVSLALLVTGSLIALTTILHRTTSDAAISVESVRLAQEAEIDLLLHGRAANALLARDLEQRMRRRLADVRQLVTSEHEKRAIAEAESRVAAYVVAARDPDATPEEREARQGAAYGALETLVVANVAFAKEARGASASWDQRANYIGIGTGLLLVAVAGVLLLWLRRRAFAPVFSLLAAMERFGNGDRDARAVEAGPTELREISRRFNELATALAAQRQAQIAFLGGVAHDLRNPLSVLKMSVALVPADGPLPPEQQLRQLIEKIGRQIKTAIELQTGKGPWEHFASQPELARDFDDAMTAVSSTVIDPVLAAYDFSGFKKVVDVGGGHGRLLAGILKSAPSVRGVVFDRPSVVEGAKPILESFGVADRCEIIGGDFFDGIPAGDAYLMKAIIHDWQDEDALKILNQVRKVIVPDGFLLLVETVVPEPNAKHFAKLLDLEMLVTGGGRERTRDEYAALFQKAGFRLNRIVATASPMSVIEAKPG